MKGQIVCIHLSDLHFTDSELTFKQLLKTNRLFSKRTVGWLNQKTNRSGHFKPDLRRRLLNTVGGMPWDYLIISGDLTTLSTRQEFITAHSNLEPLIDKGPVLLTAGNHDRYVPEALQPDLMASLFHDCFPFNRAPVSRGFHLYEAGDDVVFLELGMSLPRNHFSSRGRLLFDPEALDTELGRWQQKRFKIAVGHYPVILPPGQTEAFHHQLAGKNSLKSIIRKHRIDCYLHGHIHRSWHFQSDAFPGTHWINSAGCCRWAQGEWSGFHKITLAEGGISIERIDIK